MILIKTKDTSEPFTLPFNLFETDFEWIKIKAVNANTDPTGESSDWYDVDKMYFEYLDEGDLGNSRWKYIIKDSKSAFDFEITGGLYVIEFAIYKGFIWRDIVNYQFETIDNVKLDPTSPYF